LPKKGDEIAAVTSHNLPLPTTHPGTELEVATVAILVAEVAHICCCSKAPHTTITDKTIGVAVSIRISAGQDPPAMVLSGWVTVGIEVAAAAIFGTGRVVAWFPSTAGGERGRWRRHYSSTDRITRSTCTIVEEGYIG